MTYPIVVLDNTTLEPVTVIDGSDLIFDAFEAGMTVAFPLLGHPNCTEITLLGMPIERDGHKVWQAVAHDGQTAILLKPTTLPGQTLHRRHEARLKR